MGIVLGAVALLLLVSILVFVPPVQDFIKRKAASYVSQTMGVDLEIERLRLRFPLTLRIDNTLLRSTGGDTLANVGRLRVGVAPIPLLTGEVQARRFTVSDARVDWNDSTMVLKGNIRRVELNNVRVRPGRGRARVRSVMLSGADIEFTPGVPKIDTVETPTPPLQWRISVGHIDLDSVAFRMGSDLTARLEQGQVDDASIDLATMTTDVARVRLDGARGAFRELARVEELHLDVKDIHNRGSNIALTINNLALAEQRGLRITETKGTFAMDSLGVRIQKFNISTGAGSKMEADVTADANVLTMSPSAKMAVKIDATIAADDVALFYAQAAEYRGKMFTARIDAEGTLDDLTIDNLQLRAAPYIDLTAKGHATSVIHLEKLAGRLEIDGRFADIQQFIPESITVAIPERLDVSGSVAVDAGTYTPELTIDADGGRLDVSGILDLAKQSYTAHVEAVQFPLIAMPGRASLTLMADGHGFDPFVQTTEAKIDLGIQQFDYRGHTYNNVNLVGDLSQGHLDARIMSRDNAATADLNLRADLAPHNYSASLDGRIDTLDLVRMGFSDAPLAASGNIRITAAVAPPIVYSADVTLDSLVVVTGEYRLDIDRTMLSARADTSRISATLRSGDIYAVVNTPVGIERIAALIPPLTDTIKHQIATRNLRPAAIDSLLPTFNLNLQAGRRNAAYRMLDERGLGFGSVTVNASKGDTTALRARGVATGFHTTSLMLDTLNMGFGIRNGSLSYHLRMANRPGNLEELGLIYVYGTALGNTATVNLNQRSRQGQSGFTFGVEAHVTDSVVRASLVPAAGRRRGTARTDSLTFAYEPWSVNKGNYVEWRIGSRTVTADLDLQSKEIRPGVRRRITIRSLDTPGDIMLGISQLDIAKTLDLLPVAPPLEGMADVSLTAGLGGEALKLNGTAALRDLTYDDRRIGNIATKIATTTDNRGRWALTADASVNDKQALSLSGTYDSAGVDLVFNIPSLPLDVVNPFIPDGTVSLAGALTGNMTVKGPLPKPQLDGTLAFADGRLTVPMVGTDFRITPQQIRVSDNRVRLRDFGLLSPNNHTLSLDGSLDITTMAADMTIEASDFQVVNASRNRGSQIYGVAAMNADATIRGPLTDLAIRGDVTILRTTNITYTTIDSPLAVQDHKQNIVTFVPFTDSLALEFQTEKLKNVSSSGIDLQLTVGIEDAVRATVNLSDNGNDRIELTGGGDLSMSMNNQGDMRLTGRYNISGGTVVYNPPIPTVTQKNFTITPGGYVAWTGDIAAPDFNIQAAQMVRTTVTEEDSGLSRNVDFQLTVAVTGSLETMQIKLDLSAPDDLTIQNELSSLEPEQRADQAMALLIYNTYTGPGTTARVDTGNAVYSFIEKELNQWARNSLRGIDLSLGIRSQNDATGAQHMDYSYKVSKNLFNDRMRVSVGGSIDDGSSANANMRDNFIADVSIEYQIARWDNMFLKAYRLNTRQSILEGEVVETGGGFLYRKRAARFKDLFRISKGPQRREMRQQLRTEERRVWRDSIQRDSMIAVWRARRDSIIQAGGTPPQRGRYRRSDSDSTTMPPDSTSANSTL